MLAKLHLVSCSKVAFSHASVRVHAFAAAAVEYLLSRRVGPLQQQPDGSPDVGVQTLASAQHVPEW